MKVSFDFDGTIEFRHIKEYAKELVERGLEVWIVTSRFGDQELYQKFFNTTINVALTNNDLWEVVEETGILKERVHFTNMKNKWEFIKDKGFLWHIDDDWIENKMIDDKTSTKSISSFGNPEWREQCEKIIKGA